MDLKAEQSRLFALMPNDARCFVRVCDADDSLWVSDLPRRQSDCCGISEKLSQEGFLMRVDEASRLCYVDWTLDRWKQIIASFSDECPLIPSEEIYHEVYALCRLWLMHPAELEEEHFPVLRRIVKLTAEPPSRMLRAVRALHEEAAAQLRNGKTTAHAAGRILAWWLCKQTDGKETQP